MTYKFLPKAEQDFVDAVDYYEECECNLGVYFTSEINKSIARILEYPYAWTALSDNCRRCLVNNFPYGLIYSVKSDFVLIISVMNLHRNPNFWKTRI